MSTINESNQIIWLEVCFERRSYIFKQSIPTLQRSKPSNYRRNTIRNKNHIFTRCSLQTHTVFQQVFSESSSKNSRVSPSAALNKTFSINSLSSYGMLKEEDRISSKGSNGGFSNMIYVPRNVSKLSCKSLNPVIVEDLLIKPPASELLEGYVKEKIIKVKLKENKNGIYNIRKMYEKCIVDCYILNKFLSKDISFLPDYLKDIIKSSIEMKFSDTMIKQIKEKIFPSYPGEFLQEKETFTVLTQNGSRFYCPKNDVSQDINNDNNEFRRFFNPLLLAKTFFIKTDNKIIETVRIEKMNIIIEEITSKLIADADRPDGASRTDILILLKSAKLNLRLLKELSIQVDVWYDALLSGLFSQYRTVVEDTCMVIAFICFQPLLAQTVINNIDFDVGRDTVTAILKAMEMKPHWFNIFSFALGFIIGCCQRFSILEAIYERVHLSRQYVILAKWPNFIFYASKFWKTRHLMQKPQISLKIIQYLEFCIIKNLSHVIAKRALVSYCKRCSINCKLLTIWKGKK